MKISLKDKLSATLLGVTVAMADNDYRGYHDWDHHNGWHHHADNRVYYTGPSGYYEAPGVTYGGSYPVVVPAPDAYYTPYEPGVSVTIPIR